MLDLELLARWFWLLPLSILLAISYVSYMLKKCEKCEHVVTLTLAREAFKRSREFVLVFSSEGRILFVNKVFPHMSKLIGITSINGTLVDEWLASSCIKRHNTMISEVLKDGQERAMLIEMKFGNFLITRISKFSLGKDRELVIAIAHDVTDEFKDLEEQERETIMKNGWRLP